MVLCVFDRKLSAAEEVYGAEKLENFIPLSAFSNCKVSSISHQPGCCAGL